MRVLLLWSFQSFDWISLCNVVSGPPSVLNVYSASEELRHFCNTQCSRGRSCAFSLGGADCVFPGIRRGALADGKHELDLTEVVSSVQFQDIVVSVARKTDAQMWPALFSAVGPPSKLLDDLLGAGQLTSAACCLLIVDRIEGAAAAHTFAVRLVEVGLRFYEKPLHNTNPAPLILSCVSVLHYALEST